MIKSIESRYTNRARPNYGWHDSEVIVTFDSGTEEEQLAVMKEMQAEKAKTNMWSYKPEKVAQNTWRINYGFDSGD